MAEFTIIGGNVSGIAAALYLTEKGHTVTLYEHRIWNKPCGSAISLEFKEYLYNEWGVELNEAHQGKYMIIGLPNGNHVEIESPFVATTRLELQEKLLQLLKEKDISVNITGKRLTATEVMEVATSQTIVATGYSKLTHQLLQRTWDPKDVAHVVRFDGMVKNAEYPDNHYIIIDNKVTGYGWLFVGDNNHLNIGIGGEERSLPHNFSWKAYFDRFLSILREKYHIKIEDDLPIQGWKLPLPVNKWKYHVSYVHNGIEFIGVGDALGMAHPILGAGIEPGWLSGWCLAEATDEKGHIDTKKYQKLLRKNIKITSGRRLDIFFSILMRSRLPYKNLFAYYALKLFTRKMIATMRKHHWYKVHIYN